jgi:hypothetical protein
VGTARARGGGLHTFKSGRELWECYRGVHGLGRAHRGGATREQVRDHKGPQGHASLCAQRAHCARTCARAAPRARMCGLTLKGGQHHVRAVLANMQLKRGVRHEGQRVVLTGTVGCEGGREELAPCGRTDLKVSVLAWAESARMVARKIFFVIKRKINIMLVQQTKKGCHINSSKLRGCITIITSLLNSSTK